ncbi:MAG TPA: hypothetical protein VKR52_18965 [Terracidiphilus sp.]|nr:hypothetical protein [Terracidiphilus sp.]
MRIHPILGFPLAVLVLFASTSAAQAGAGEVSFANSGAKAAQEPFLHGLALLHNFEYEDALAEFRRAESIDPNFAMAYWGEAMTFNHAVWNEQDRGAALAALNRLATTPEARLAKAPTEREKDYLRALDVLYGDGPKPARDQQYVTAMSSLHAKYPDDVDASAFYALALLGSGEGVRNERVYMQAAAILMPLFYKYPHHPGVAHYLIHSCDDPIHAPLALPAARAYSRIAPEAAHAQHMTSHIFLALGMWNDVIEANEAARRVVNQHLSRAGKGTYRCGHSIYWLEYGYLEAGRIDDAKALTAACRDEASESGMIARANNVSDPDDASLLSYIVMRTRFLIDTAQWDSDPAHWHIDAGDVPLAQFDLSYAGGFRAAEKGDLPAAHNALAQMDAALPLLPAVFDRSGAAADEPDRQVPAIERLQVKALILSDEGKLDESVATARKAAEAESSLPYAFGPPTPEKPSFELLAELLLKQNHPQEAAEACKQALLRAPNRIQSVALLARASAAASTSAAMQ